MQTKSASIKWVKTLCFFIGLNMLACSHATVANVHQIKHVEKQGHHVYRFSTSPWHLAGHTMVLSIQSVDADSDVVSPTQGVIVQRYNNRRDFSARGVGGANHVLAEGGYRYYKKGMAAAVEKTIDKLNGQRFTTRYQFETTNFGTFVRQNEAKSLTITGQFSLSKSEMTPAEELAEADHGGLTVAVNILQGDSQAVPKGYYPERALVLQRYKADGTYSAIGFGPATIPHSGTYRYEKVSANVAIEETIQVAETFTAPFTMVYFYQTPTSGIWYQDFGNGTIKFSGTFSTYETQVIE